MGYRSSGSNFASKMAVVLAVSIAAGGANFAVETGIAAYRAATADPEGAFEEAASRPEVAPLYTAFRESYPAEYQAFKRGLTGLGPTVSADEAFVYGRRWMKAFMQRKHVFLAQANHEGLIAYRKAQMEVISELEKQSIPACGRFVANGLSESDRPQGAAQDAIMRSATTQIRVFAQAEASPVGRVLAEPTESEVVELISLLKQSGASDDEIASLTGEGGLTSASSETQCAFGRHLYGAIATMPPAQHDRWLAFFASSS